LPGFIKRLGLTSSGALSALVGGGATAIIFGQGYPLLGMVVSGTFLFWSELSGKKACGKEIQAIRHDLVSKNSFEIL
jgi:hypothetical protein